MPLSRGGDKCGMMRSELTEKGHGELFVIVMYYI